MNDLKVVETVSLGVVGLAIGNRRDKIRDKARIHLSVTIDLDHDVDVAGFEDFTAFDRNFVKEFSKTIKTSGFFSDRELEDLSMFILGFRFSGWLNEWINDSDNEMIDREINYLNFLKNLI